MMTPNDLFMIFSFFFEIFAFVFIIVFFCYPKLFSKLNRSTIINLICVYLCINFMLACTNFGYVCILRSRTSARQKACYSNIRVLQGAVEMYNMDNKTLMTTLDIKKLEEGNYLKPNSIKKPEYECDYFSDGDLSKEGVVACKLHSDEKYYKEWEKREHRSPQSFWDSGIGKVLSLFWHSPIGRLFRALFFPVTLPFLLG